MSVTKKIRRKRLSGHWYLGREFAISLVGKNQSLSEEGRLLTLRGGHFWFDIWKGTSLLGRRETRCAPIVE